MSRSITFAVGISLCFVSCCALAQVVTVPNASFEEGGDAPLAWTLSEGEGAWEQAGHEGRRSVSVTGTGDDNNYWRLDGVPLEPGVCYRFSYWVRTDPDTSGGCIVSGPSGVNRDFRAGDEWEQRSFVFTPARPDDFIRLGQWHVQGKVHFDDVQIQRVLPIHERRGELVLGDGERIQDGTYEFRPRWSGDGANYSRTLVRARASFNSNRWPMGQDAELVYKLGAPGLRQRAATVTANLSYYQAGRCLIQASKDGENWADVGAIAEQSSGELELRADLFPAEHVWVRLAAADAPDEAGNGKPGSFQISNLAYAAELADSPADLRGGSRFLAVERTSPDLDVQVVSLGDLMPGARQEAQLLLRNRGADPLNVAPAIVIAPPGQTVTPSAPGQVAIPAGRQITATIPYEVPGAGDFEARLLLASQPSFAARSLLFTASTAFTVPSLYEAGYGHLITDEGDCPLWWCEGTYKISRQRPLPREERAAIKISAARNEYEPFQLVLRPTKALEGVTVAVTDLQGPGEARIPAKNVTIDHVGYVTVHTPTDATGCEGDWPDPLPHYDGPFAAEAGQNHPLWLTVYVPPEARAGDYRATVTLKAGAWTQRVPVELRVWNFALPEESHIRSAFGFSPGTMRRYHNLETAEEYAEVVDLYFRNFAAHRINPYDPMCLGPMGVDFGGGAWNGGSHDEAVKHGGARSLKLVDTDTGAVIQANNAKLMPVTPGQQYRLSWWVKTEAADQSYLVTLQTYDAARQWISGHNIDIAKTGIGEWQHEEADVSDRINERARFCSLVLRPALWTEDGRHTGTAWFDDLALTDIGEGANLLADPGIEEVPSADDVKIDFTAFDREAEKYLDGLKFRSFRLALAGMGGGTFHSRRKGSIGGYEQGTPEYEALFRAYVQQLQQHLEDKGWLDEAYIYWFDEPAPKDYEFVREGMELIKRHAPKLNRMLTEQPEPELFGAVDTWCPVTGGFKPEICRARQEAGEHIWWYVCTGPKAPFCTLFIDHNAIELRMWLWQTWKYGVESCLVWTSNYWTSSAAFPAPELQNPWDDPMSYVSGYDTPAGVRRNWGNGDGRFIYPPNKDVSNDKTKYIEGPVNSIRWEMLREGFEDTEYFFALKEIIDQAPVRRAREAKYAAAARLLEVPEEITSGMTEFTKDPQPLHAHREKLARAIEELSK